MHLHENIVVQRPRDEVYAFWRNLTQLPQFMEHLVSVTGDPDGISHWTAKAPTGAVEWDAKIVEDKPGEMISWRSLEDSEVRNSGAVRFLDAKGGGTEVAVDISFDPPMGILGEAVAKLFGEAPDQQVADDLKRFKTIMESGQAKVASPGQTVAAAARAELIASRGSTHAASNEPDPERDVATDAVVMEPGGDAMMLGGSAVENVTYSSTGVAGNMAAGQPGVASGGVVPDVRTTSDAPIANDIDPAQRGLRTGADQDKIDPNDRDLAKRGPRAPL